MTDHFSPKAHWTWGSWSFKPPAGDQGVAIFISSSDGAHKWCSPSPETTLHLPPALSTLKETTYLHQKPSSLCYKPIPTQHLPDAANAIRTDKKITTKHRHRRKEAHTRKHAAIQLTEMTLLLSGHKSQVKERITRAEESAEVLAEKWSLAVKTRGEKKNKSLRKQKQRKRTEMIKLSGWRPTDRLEHQQQQKAAGRKGCFRSKWGRLQPCWAPAAQTGSRNNCSEGSWKSRERGTGTFPNKLAEQTGEEKETKVWKN